jgi:hypothetical protein|tara:strand:- start:19424 stop:19621 length:198 start_codon:yes stop_codon:yes gene_type:complete
MATDHIEVIGVTLAFLFAISMFVQGYLILHGKGGYRNVHKEKAESINMRRRVEKLLKDKTHGDME